jgi:hypothetical protein
LPRRASCFAQGGTIGSEPARTRSRKRRDRNDAASLPAHNRRSESGRTKTQGIGELVARQIAHHATARARFPGAERDNDEDPCVGEMNPRGMRIVQPVFGRIVGVARESRCSGSLPQIATVCNGNRSAARSLSAGSSDPAARADRRAPVAWRRASTSSCQRQQPSPPCVAADVGREGSRTENRLSASRGRVLPRTQAFAVAIPTGGPRARRSFRPQPPPERTGRGG